MAVNGVIFAKRVTFPIDGHHDALQIGVISEANAEHVEGFALIPIRASPEVGDRIEFLMLTDANGQAKAGVVAIGMEEVDHFKARFARPPIDAGDATQTFEGIAVFEELADGPNVLGGNDKHRAVGGLFSTENGIGIAFFNKAGNGVFRD